MEVPQILMTPNCLIASLLLKLNLGVCCRKIHQFYLTFWIMMIDTALRQAVMRFKRDTIDTDCPRQLFVVCRSECVEQLKMDILSAYKNSCTKLRATSRVRFEGKEEVGTGPVREFFFLAIKLVDEGMIPLPNPLSILKENTTTEFLFTINLSDKQGPLKLLVEFWGTCFCMVDFLRQ